MNQCITYQDTEREREVGRDRDTHSKREKMGSETEREDRLNNRMRYKSVKRKRDTATVYKSEIQLRRVKARP